MGEAISIDRLNLVLFLVAVAVLLSFAAVILSAWCVVMIRRILRGETPWQATVSGKVFPEPAVVSPAIQPAPVPHPPLPDYAAEEERGSSPSEVPGRATVLPRRRR